MADIQTAPTMDAGNSRNPFGDNGVNANANANTKTNANVNDSANPFNASNEFDISTPSMPAALHNNDENKSNDHLDNTNTNSNNHSSAAFPNINTNTNTNTPIFPNDVLSSAADREQRAKRLKEDAVRRLVSDINRTAIITVNPTGTANNGVTPNHPTHPATTNTNTVPTNSSTNTNTSTADELLVASTIATAIERNLDRELHADLTKQMKESASSISKICHEHSDDFLHSVGKVVALGVPCQRIRRSIDLSIGDLEARAGGPMLMAANQLECAKSVTARAVAVQGIVKACVEVAGLLERARRQAGLARPKSALDAVDEARGCLTAPLSVVVGLDKRGGSGGLRNLVDGYEVEDMGAYFDALLNESEVVAPTEKLKDGDKKNNAKGDKTKHNNSNDGSNANNNNTSNNASSLANSNAAAAAAEREETNELRLEDTPFGARAMTMLPIIENEVLMGARRGLNRWFLSIRSGGDGAKAGRAALRKCAHSMAIGPGQLGLGGNTRGYTWRAKNADNLIARVTQKGIVARAIRMGYWFQRDHAKEVKRLELVCGIGIERRAEAFASAFGWYRCWEEEDPLEVEETRPDASDRDKMNRSGHGLNRSGHGLQSSSSRHGRSLSYRATHRRDDSLTFRSGADIKRGSKKKGPSQWSVALTPAVLFDNAPNKVEDETKLAQIPDSVYPVRRAEAAFSLLGKTEEFRQYYEQNRFGDMKIGDKTDEDGYEKETRSSLSSLTGDDVSQGTDRNFFARSLPHLCTSVVGFSTIEAALELGNNLEEDESAKIRDDVANAGGVDESVLLSFRGSSARYERKLIKELGSLLRGRAIGATLVELSRASYLMAAFRSALKIVHPSSGTRNTDKELIAMDVDILMTGLKVAQEEQRRATRRIVSDDIKDAMLVPLEKSEFRYGKDENTTNIPSEEVKGFPFGLSDQKEKPNNDKSIDEAEGGMSRKSRMYQGKFDDKEKFRFSISVPLIIRSIHSRAIAFAAFASSQEELGQVFASNNGGGIAGYVLDCVEQLIVLAAIGMKENNSQTVSSVAEAVQIMANITALKSALPRLLGVIMRGLFHLGMARGDQLEESFEYAESALKKANESCDNQTKSMFNTLYNICQIKTDELLQISLDNFQWVARNRRDSPNTYCESLIDHLRKIFKCLKMLDDGPKAMLYFSICGHITERMVNIITGKPEDMDSKKKKSNSGLSPISKIDAFGLKNLSIDVQALEIFADGTGLPQLRTCFNELRWLTDALLDPDLPTLLSPENENARRRKHPFLQLDLIANVLEKYQGSGGIGGKLLGSTQGSEPFLILEKKEIFQLLKIVRIQIKKGG